MRGRGGGWVTTYILSPLTLPAPARRREEAVRDSWEASPAKERGAGARSSLAARSGLSRTPKGRTQISGTEVPPCEEGRDFALHIKKRRVKTKGGQFTKC